jgi:hypothetical protein
MHSRDVLSRHDFFFVGISPAYSLPSHVPYTLYISVLWPINVVAYTYRTQENIPSTCAEIMCLPERFASRPRLRSAAFKLLYMHTCVRSRVRRQYRIMEWGFKAKITRWPASRVVNTDEGKWWRKIFVIVCIIAIPIK